MGEKYLKNQIHHLIDGEQLAFPSYLLHERFYHIAQKYPNNLAIKSDNKLLNYSDLKSRVDSVSNFLYNEGLRPGQIVVVSLSRTPEFIISILAILKCGACYLPIDVDQPKSRIELVLKDSEAEFFISNENSNPPFSKTKKISVDNIIGCYSKSIEKHPKINVTQDSLAYIIYTSGSTGIPKGVKVSHRNVVNFINYMTRTHQITSKDRIFNLMSISFDPMVSEVFLPLLNGAALIQVSEKTKKDGELLTKQAIEDKVSFAMTTPSICRLMLDGGWSETLNIKIMSGGEPLQIPLAKELLDRCESLWNLYGPTETTVCSTAKKVERSDTSITIGKPIDNTYIYLLNEDGKPVAQGEIGEIAIGGAGVSQGYLKNPILNSERFIEDTLSGENSSKLYLTGDLGKLNENGEIICLERKDNQIKIRGNRVEIGEIETIINNITDVKLGVVSTYQTNGETKLVAYIQQEPNTKKISNLKEIIGRKLPAYMIPSFVMWVDDFPITTNGKIDFKNLPKPLNFRPESAPLFRNANSELEKNIQLIWLQILNISSVGIDDNFFELGGTSILTQKLVSLLKLKLDIKVSVANIYKYNTIANLANFIEKGVNSELHYRKPSQDQNKNIAVVAMSGRFPGAESVEELWDVLKEGRETIKFFKPEELDPSIPSSLVNDPLYIKARGVVPSARTFDYSFFGLTPRMAEAMDPQQRIFLEISWEVLEKSGHLPEHYSGKIGTYAGCGNNTYYKNNIAPRKDIVDELGAIQITTINEKDYIASRTAYHLNLTGPAVSVHSACSTSLLAIAEAVKAIRSGQCDLALAGGSNITSPINSGHLYQEGAMYSNDGHCRPFDARAQGTLFSDGAGVVLLKDYDKAIEDGDTIFAVIKGIGVNNDGGSKGSFTAPSSAGQAGAISDALNDADITADNLSYVEAHGTATPIGDPIEIEGLKSAFGPQKHGDYCALGSIKSNLGHLNAAAGIAGFIKTILALHYKQIPPSIGFDKPNSLIDFENSPFYVNTELTPWDSKTSRIAGISSFGVGGTNVHIIAEEFQGKTEKSGKSRPKSLITWSSKNEQSQKDYTHKLGDYISENPKLNLADLAYSLTQTRANFPVRSFIVGESSKETATLLSKNSDKINSSKVLRIAEGLVFMFPGQGAQHLQMGNELYEQEPVYKNAVDTCAEILKEYIKEDIRKIIYPENNGPAQEEKLKNTRYAQPALFVTEYALAKLWVSWGINPTHYCGHSIGEFVAAHLSGIFSLEDALHVISERGRIVSELPQGSMLSVRISIDKLNEFLPSNLSISAINSKNLIVVAGPDAEIDSFSNLCEERGVLSKKLLTSHAFHSLMMDPAVEPFEKLVSKIELNKPKKPIISSVTGQLLTDEEACSAIYWSTHLRNTVRFSDALNTIATNSNFVLLEIGPGRTLSTLAKQQIEDRSYPVYQSLSGNSDNESTYTVLLETLGNLWLKGFVIDWKSFYKEEQRIRLRLPAYAFDRKLCWVDPPKANEELLSENHYFNSSKINTPNPVKSIDMQNATILNKIGDIISNNAGIEITSEDAKYSFIELGLDSLVLTQLSNRLKQEFKLPITFRQLNKDLGSPALLAAYIREQLPPEDIEIPPQQNQAINQNGKMESAQNQRVENFNFGSTQQTALSLIAQQIQLLGKQMELLQGNSSQEVNSQNEQSRASHQSFSKNVTPSNEVNSEPILTSEEEIEHKKPFGASPKIEKQATTLNAKQSDFLKLLIKRYTQKTAGSKASTEKHRPYMADPRVVSGFKPLTKEIVYPIVIEKSSGNRLWDIDGNEYIDALNGFGSCLFGHQPDFIKKALHYQIEKGYEVGPQHPLAGEVCNLLCEFTGLDRAGLCNTGSEAVMGAMRIARTITGRSLIVAFSGSYHGINDEVLVRGSKKLISFPAAAGIMPETAKNILILDYGTNESLEIIRERAHELAAVLVEPVQSRRPEFRPVEFLREIRQITEKSGTALIFDEVITGFRMHPGGAQALFDIKADIATYGKVIGGGLSIGAIVGKKHFMDALDGGQWQFGDDSYPEVGVTYFAGTFVRHPLALAASKASLQFMKEQGPSLQSGTSAMAEYLAKTLNSEFENKNIPIIVNYFGSLWRIKFTEEIPYSELLFTLLREKGFHIWDGFPCFMTIAFTDKDVNKLINAVLESVEELINADFFKNLSTNVEGNKYKISDLFKTPPSPNAVLSRDVSGNPVWKT